MNSNVAGNWREALAAISGGREFRMSVPAGSTENPGDRIPGAPLLASTVLNDAGDPHILIRSTSSTVMSSAVRL